MAETLKKVSEIFNDVVEKNPHGNISSDVRARIQELDLHQGDFRPHFVGYIYGVHYRFDTHRDEDGEKWISENFDRIEDIVKKYGFHVADLYPHTAHGWLTIYQEVDGYGSRAGGYVEWEGKDEIGGIDSGTISLTTCSEEIGKMLEELGTEIFNASLE